MIFNKEYNRIIDLMGELDEDFIKDYQLFARRLPMGMVHKCQKMGDFNCVKGEKKYKMRNYNGDEVEFIVEDGDLICSSINLYRINVDALETMGVQDSEDNIRNINDTSIMEIGVFETTKKSGNKVGYSLYMCRRENGYFAVMEKVTNDETLNRKTVAKIDVERAIKRKTGR